MKSLSNDMPLVIMQSSRNSAGAIWSAHKSLRFLKAPRSLHVVIEFPDYASALACYHSPEYQANKKIRDGHLVADFVIVEGYDGPQPRGQAAPQRFSELFVRQ